GDVLLPEGEIGPGRDHVAVVVREGGVVPRRPLGETEADLGVSGHVDDPGGTLPVVAGQASLPLAVDLDRRRRALSGTHLLPSCPPLTPRRGVRGGKSSSCSSPLANSSVSLTVYTTDDYGG